ncbi:hypothetical protein H310_13145 [Aphanomyces invadans]|uniref:PDZ domain-containing protein n=1 Tax=Aphanomyces invadans TaxID=157072 RepID=A0A024TF98_9STRA|nr:hypothetical protein H310_13145 [Aphanomyces invadans]ETV92718.1 hypothetical protein H310_13145 [Aphanomyces invadans]|eukprot:XP_008878754.1 hypothetical protein H310_13145 [Aphanomyces invadans]
MGIEVERHPGEYTCCISATDGQPYTESAGVRFTKPFFAKWHQVKAIEYDVLRQFVTTTPGGGWSSVHVGHVLVAVNGEWVGHMTSSELRQLLKQLSPPTEFTFRDDCRAQLEVSLLRNTSYTLPTSFQSLESIERQLELVQSYIFSNQLNQAIAIISALPPGCHFHVPLFRAEIQCLRALLTGDNLSIDKAVADATAAVSILGKFTDLPQLSRTDKLLVDIALAEALAFSSMAQLLAGRSHAGVAATLRRCHQLYTQIYSACMAEPSSLWDVPAMALQDVLGRAQFGVGAFALFASGVVPSEYHWILQLWQRSSLQEGVRMVHMSWAAGHSRSHWAGLLLMNSSPMLLQHWVAARKAKGGNGPVTPLPSNPSSTAPRATSVCTAREYHDSAMSTASDGSDSDDSPLCRPERAQADADDVLMEALALLHVATTCLQTHPQWIMFMWSRSVQLQHANPFEALDLAQEAAASYDSGTPYLLQVYIGRLQFKLHRMDQAADTFQRVMAAYVKSRAVLTVDAQQTTCTYLAAALCCESDANVRFVRSLLAQTLRLQSESPTSVPNGSVDICLLVHRARYYHAIASDIHVKLLPYDLLYVCSDSSHVLRKTRAHDDSALAHLDSLMVKQFPAQDAALPP